MRFELRRSLLLLAAIASKAGGNSRKADPSAVSFHAAHAAQAADVAEQAAAVANRVAAHSQDVAHSTASALRYTRDALRQANADEQLIADIDKKMEIFEDGVEHEDIEGRYNPLAQEEQEGDEAIRSASSKDSRGKESEDSDSHRVGAPNNLDIKSEIAPQPNGVEPFGNEEPAREMTEASVKESNGMVDQIENAQGVEAKRAVYRALTKLRGAAIASYDGMARAHLKNVDDYNQKHKWREEHPYRHLAEEEGDVAVWAFPSRGKPKLTSEAKVPEGISAAQL